MAEELPEYEEVDYARPFTAAQIERKVHRRHVGGRWHRIGKMQLDFLVAEGLKPKHQFIDVACGALRAGRYFVKYLKPGRYYGVDINETLLDAGYEHELGDRLRQKLPRDHLRQTERFDCDFGVTFDYGIAQSLFTHISLNHIRLCLYRVAKVMEPGGRFYATFFEAEPDQPLDVVRPGRKGVWTERNPFFYYAADLEWAASFSPWKMRYIGDWGHPKGQRIVEFRRIDPSAPPPSALRRIAKRIPGARAAFRAIAR